MGSIAKYLFSFLTNSRPVSFMTSKKRLREMSLLIQQTNISKIPKEVS
jgi:hypothetical protein